MYKMYSVVDSVFTGTVCLAAYIAISSVGCVILYCLTHDPLSDCHRC